MDDHDEEKRREQNLVVYNSKTEAEVAYNSRLRSTYCTLKLTILTDTKHSAASLQLTAGLLVSSGADGFKTKYTDVGTFVARWH